MTPETLHPCAHRIALTYPFTEHCWPFGPEYDVFKVDGRIFMITMTIRGRALVNLKAEPQKSLLNQQIYRTRLPYEQETLDHGGARRGYQRGSAGRAD